ncbi:MAG: hypothetical protein WC299_14890 [Kiritimatiellia bacterium]
MIRIAEQRRHACSPFDAKMKRWNKKTGRYERFSPGERDYPALPSRLAQQAVAIPTTHFAGLTYCPCAAELTDRSELPCVYLVEASAYIKVWGIWPDQDEGKREVGIADVVAVRESPFRLPARFAQELYDAGESGMGYVGYEIEFTDGTRQAYLTGNGLDFVELPQGKGVGDIVKAWPHEGLRNAPRQTPDFVWCLYGKK